MLLMNEEKERKVLMDSLEKMNPDEQSELAATLMAIYIDKNTETEEEREVLNEYVESIEDPQEMIHFFLNLKNMADYKDLCKHNSTLEEKINKNTEDLERDLEELISS